MSEEEIKKILNQILKRNGVTFFGYTSKEVGNTAIKEALNLIDKLQKENESLKICLKAEEKLFEGLNEDIKSLLNIEPNTNFIHKDVIKAKIEELEEELKYEITKNEAKIQINLLKGLLEE